jgi:hypothetical protein
MKSEKDEYHHNEGPHNLKGQHLLISNQGWLLHKVRRD